MNTRIRYKESQQGTLTSTKPIMLPNGTLINVNIFLGMGNECSYNFLSTNNTQDKQDVVSQGTAPNLVAAKKLVRDTLIAAGVKFQTEKRQRKVKTTEEAA